MSFDALKTLAPYLTRALLLSVGAAGCGEIAPSGVRGTPQGGVTTLAQGPQGEYLVGATALDDANFYWLLFTGDSQSILSVPKAGGATSTVVSGLAPTGQPGPGGPVLSLAADGTNVYCSLPLAPGAVVRVPRGGGSPTTIALGADNGEIIAVDNTNLYWVGGAPPIGMATQGAVMTMPKAGGPVVTLAATPPIPLSLSVNDTFVTWQTETSSGVGTITSVPKGGGAAVTVASNVTFGEPFAFADAAVDDTNVYFPQVDPSTSAGFLMAAPVAGGTAFTLASVGGYPGGSSPEVAVSAIAVDGTNVYWTELGTPGLLRKVSRMGGTALTIVADEAGNNPSGIQVDGTNVYWIDINGNVKSVEK